MTGREIAIAVISSVSSGLIVWIVQQAYLNRREKRRRSELRVVKAPHSARVVTDAIFLDLSPGKTVALMKEMLGAPVKHARAAWPVFAEQEVKTHCYLYEFSNARVKVTSKDDESIDSLTIFCHDRSLSMSSILMPEGVSGGRIGEAKVSPGLLERCDHSFIQTRIDSSFALRTGTGAPFYLWYTFFGYADQWKYRAQSDPSIFVGQTIEGVCVSGSREDVHFIYEYELA